MPFDLYRTLGYQAYDGEPVSQLEHAPQTAGLARVLHPAGPEFVLAAFLHDGGHLRHVHAWHDGLPGLVGRLCRRFSLCEPDGRDFGD